MYEKILVPLDGSKAAEMVIPYAEEMAARLGRPMILASVSEPVPADTEYLYQAYIERIAGQVQGQLGDWKPGKEVVVQSKVLIGRPADEILRYADENNVGLIAMTSHGSSGRGPWPLGNIVAKVLRATAKPLLLIRASAREAAIQQKRLVRKILVPLDGSELGAIAMPFAEGLGQALGAELVFFYVVEPEPIATAAATYATTIPYPPAKAEGQAKADAAAYLEGAAKSARHKGLNISTAVYSGSSAECIIDYAKANSIDLIAMSTHGRKGIGRWVFGSVTDKVLHAGDTAVLVVRAPRP